MTTRPPRNPQFHETRKRFVTELYGTYCPRLTRKPETTNRMQSPSRLSLLNPELGNIVQLSVQANSE